MNSNLHCLVTGASGFIGRTVLSLALTEPNAPKMVTAGRKPCNDYLLDLAEPTLVLPDRIHTVLHMAGEKRDHSRMLEVNQHGTRRLAEAAARSGAKRFIYVSSVGSYGAPLHSGTVDEHFPHSPRNAYEISKEAGEEVVREVCARNDMTAVILQPSNVIGLTTGLAAQPLLGLMRIIRRGAFVWFGAGDPWVNYVAVDDVAKATLAALQGAPGGSYIVNTPARLRDVVGWISSELGLSTPHRRLPLSVGNGAATIGSVLERITGRGLPFQRERFHELINTTRYDPSHLMKTIGFAYPVGIETLIRTLVQSYRREGLL